MNNLMLTRRSLLRRTLMAGTGLAAFGAVEPVRRLALGAGPEGRDLYYVFAYFSGGWDILLSLDPRDPVTFNEENVRNTRIQPAYDQLEDSDGQLVRTPNNMVFGPYIGELARHAERLAVLRGMSMETLTHEAGRRRFLTGKAPSGLQARGSSGATHLAARLGSAEPIPNLAIQVESYNVDQPNYATGLKANGGPDLIRALQPSNPDLGARQNEQLDALLRQLSTCESMQRSATWQAAESGRQKAREMVGGELFRLFDFSAPGEAMERIRDRYQIPSGSAGLTSYEARAAMAAQAIKGGVSRVVSIQVAGGLDTHFDEWATNQGPNQVRGFNAIARLIDDLQQSPYKDTGESWLDHTVIIGFSEFSRTPMLNARGGRDHSLTNCAFLTGAGIRGGRVIGQSSDRGMEPTTTNLESGEYDPAGEVIRPEHVIRTLLDSAGFEDDVADMRVGPIRALQA